MGQTSSQNQSPAKGGFSGFLSYFTSAGAKETLTKEEIAKLSERRAKIAREILQTEESYLTSLEKLVGEWEAPMRKLATESKSFISLDDVRAIFSTSEVICGLHRSLLKELRARISTFSDKTFIGDIFMEHAPILKLYTEFVNNFDNAIDTLEKCLKNKKFVEFLQQVSGQPNTMVLNSLLIQPVQRLPRYEMLLTDLVKHTWESHPDITNLRTALVKIKETADFVNESKRRSENRARLLEIQNLVGMKLCIPSRQIIREIEILKLKKKERKPMQCCILNDSILLWRQFDKKSGKVSLFADLELIRLAAGASKDGDIIENVLFIASGKKEVTISIPESAKMTPDQFVEIVVKARLEYQNLENRLTPHATPTKQASTPKQSSTPETKPSNPTLTVNSGKKKHGESKSADVSPMSSKRNSTATTPQSEKKTGRLSTIFFGAKDDDGKEEKSKK